MRDLRELPLVGGGNRDGIERGLLVAATVVLKNYAILEVILPVPLLE
jgi:hypothetical protein